MSSLARIPQENNNPQWDIQSPSLIFDVRRNYHLYRLFSVTNENGDNLFHLVSKTNNLPFIRFIISTGFDPLIKNYRGLTALELTSDLNIKHFIFASQVAHVFRLRSLRSLHTKFKYNKVYIPEYESEFRGICNDGNYLSVLRLAHQMGIDVNKLINMSKLEIVKILKRYAQILMRHEYIHF